MTVPMSSFDTSRPKLHRVEFSTDWLTCGKLLEGQMPPPRNHAILNRDVLMEVISSLKVGKKQLQQWLYFVQIVIFFANSFSRVKMFLCSEMYLEHSKIMFRVL